jgi:hypothetical protein
VLEIITSKTGRDISQFAFFQGESEVLFKPSTRFTVLARYTRSMFNDVDDDWQPQTGPRRDQALAYWKSDDKKSTIKMIVLKEEVG